MLNKGTTKMARTVSPLTNTEVKQAKPKDKVYQLNDGKGLGLRVKPSGSKVWLLDYYRPYTKKRTTLTLGNYPLISLAEARSKRDEALKLLAEDIDPKSHREEQAVIEGSKLTETLEANALRWLDVKKSKVSEDHADKLYRSLELHVLPSLGKVPIHQIRAPQTIEVLKPLAAKGSLETVKRVCQRLNEVMSYAVNTGVIDANPLANIKDAFSTPKKQNLPTIKPEKLPELMSAIAHASIKRTTRCLIEWQLHTMVRPSEAAGARWSEIDFDSKVWVIPAERMKKKKEHTVPLSGQALNLLEVMKPISSHREFIFPSDRNPRSHCHSSTANTALKRMGFHGELVSHGLRSLASTTLNEQGFNPDIIETALAHSDKNEVRAAYNRAAYLEQRRVMMSWWSEHIEKAATGNMSMTSGVKQLRGISA